MMYLFGEFIDSDKIDVELAEQILEQAYERQSTFATYPIEKSFSVLAKVKELWSDENSPYRKEALDKLPEITGFSRPMIEEALKHVQFMLDPETLRKKLETELVGYPRLGELKDQPGKREYFWSPLGVCLHVISGNVFLAGLGSFIEGVLTSNMSLLKMSSQETFFLPLFLKSLKEVDEEGVLSASVAAFNYSSSQKEVLDTLKNQVDGLVVWGGDEAISAYRNGTPARTRMIEFGPKLSLAYISKNTLKTPVELAQKIADDLSIWDQQACTAPQMIYCESPELAKNLIDALTVELDHLQKTRPLGEVDSQSAVEIQKLRSIAELEMAMGIGYYKAPLNDLHYTLWGTQKTEIESSPLYRTLRIVMSADLETFKKEASQFRGHLQTLGLECHPEEYESYRSQFLGTGIVRIMPLGQMAGGAIDDPHDGQYDLRQLMNLSFCYRPVHQVNYQSSHFADRADLQKAIEVKLQRLGENAKKSEYYGKILATRDLKSLEDLEKFPILTRDLLDENHFPQSDNLTTKNWTGGYVTRSGGSTGQPKFSIYDGEDWQRMMDHGELVLRSAGLEESDRLANFMLAGDLYGGFVSFDEINKMIGLTSFSFAGSRDAQLFSQIQQQFAINVVMGVPTSVLPLLREAKGLNPDLQLEKLIYAGSPLSKSDRTWLEEELGTKRIASVIGANDGGQIAFQCEKQQGRMHHLVDDFNYVEIVDEKGQKLEDGLAGRILITSLEKFAFPLIRYDIGDLGKIHTDLCSCGRKSRVLEYLGRSDQSLAIGMLNIDCRHLDPIFSDFGVTEYQIRAISEEGQEGIKLALESNTWTESNKGQLQDQLFKNVKNLQKRMDEGYLKFFEIDFLRSGEIPRDLRTGKTKRIIDERI